MRTDRYGLPLTTSSDAGVEAYRAGVDCILSAWPGAARHLEAALAHDPEFALAAIARARVHQMHAEMAEARARAAEAAALAERASERERRHVAIIHAAIHGEPGKALTWAEEHLEQHPRDALVMALLLGAFGLYAFSGRADHDAARLALCERHARHYGPDWWFLGYLGWSHTEASNPTLGREITEQALALRRDNANAAHALSHAFFEQGDDAAALDLVRGWLPGYGRDGILHGHIAWHLALLAIARDDLDEALRVYETSISPANSMGPPLNVFTDSASLMWRMQLAGRDGLHKQWQEIGAFATRSFPRAGIPFADVHVGLLAAGPEDAAAIEQRLAALETLLAEGRLAPGPVVGRLVRGFSDFAAGDYATAIATLDAAMPDAVRIGGSHAQREIIEDTLIVACLRGGRPERARALIDARLHRRPSARDERWRTMAM